MIAALATIVLAMWLTRSIVRPLGEAVIAAEYVAAGDLTQTIRVEGRDEVSRLLRALEQMQDKLRSALRLIGGSATQLASAARSEEHTSELQSHHDLVCR